MLLSPVETLVLIRRTKGVHLCLWKNKTTKTFFVAEFHSLIMNNRLSPYFFLVVFFAFFAGAFFVAMYSSPPFIR
jgi:hypothetical protein